MLNTTPRSKRIKRDLDLSSAAVFCDRTGVYDRTAASIVSATLKDVDIVTEEEYTNVIGKKSVDNEVKNGK